MDRWQLDFLERCCAAAPQVTLSDGAFGPGPALWIGKREIAHFDAERTLDVRLTKPAIRSRRDELKRDDRVSLRDNPSDWLTIVVAADDIEWAIAVVCDAVAANVDTAPRGLPPTGHDLERRRRFH